MDFVWQVETNFNLNRDALQTWATNGYSDEYEHAVNCVSCENRGNIFFCLERNTQNTAAKITSEEMLKGSHYYSWINLLSAEQCLFLKLQLQQFVFRLSLSKIIFHKFHLFEALSPDFPTDNTNCKRHGWLLSCFRNLFLAFSLIFAKK